MLNQLIQLFLLALASVIVMILHELPKSIIYTKLYNIHNNSNKRNVFALDQYIDPIGLIFCITNLTGFSKPYVYRLNNKKMNRTLAITGYASLLFVFFISIGVVNFMNINYGTSQINEVSLLIGMVFSFFLYMATVSMGMLLVNLFPIATFDMGLLVASISSEKYYSIISNDYFIKMILILAVIFGFVSNLAIFILNIFIMGSTLI